MQARAFILKDIRGVLASLLTATNDGVGLFLLFACVGAGHAQDLPDVAQGLQPYAAYHGGQLDKVNTLNGSLTVRIPLVSYPQKGSLDLSFSVVITPYVYRMIVQCPTGTGGSTGELLMGCNGGHANVGPAPIGTVTGGLGTQLIVDQALSVAGVSTVDPNYGSGDPSPMMFGRYYVVTSDNAQHPLGRLADGSGFRSVDREGYLFVPSSLTNFPTQLGTSDPTYPGDITQRAAGVAGTITDSHGRVYSSGNITDPDGNTIQLGNPTVTGSITDSVSRSIPTSATTTDTSHCPNLPLAAQYSQSATSAMAWSVPGPGGTSATYIFCYISVPITTHFTKLVAATEQYSTTYTLIQSIVLPNGTYWGFVYGDGLGDLTTLYYPTGGWVTYTYQENGGFCDSVRYANNPSYAQTYTQGVTSRTEFDSNGTILGTWSYALAYAPGGNAVITTPTHLEAEAYPSDGTSCGAVDGGTTVFSDLTGTTTLKSENISFAYPSIPGAMLESPYPISTTTTLNDGSSSTVQEHMDSGVSFQEYECEQASTSLCNYPPTATIPLGSKISTISSDFSGTILKQEQESYLWQSNSAYLAANLIDLPASDSLLDGSGNTIETTNYTYDESTYAPGETTVRGHLTTVSKSLNMASGPAPTVHTGWNTSGIAAGEKAYSVDANGNTTSYAYSSAGGSTGTGGCNGSLVTSTNNALSQSISGAYDCNTGLLTSLVDLNGNTTSVTWDAMRRITLVTYPAIPAGTPTTSFVYTDSANTVTKTVAASPDPSQTTTVTFDGFGRELTRVGSTGSGGAEVDTTYDADGRVNSVSNPYYSPSDATYGVTTTAYDALNRPLVVTMPDGNTTTTSYTGPTTDSWDENGTHMQHTTDALGRLVKVMELGTTADSRSLETDYTYDALDSLLSVNQHGASGETPRTRSFTYDSLARLITSTNPETGTICYGFWSGGSCLNGYDANGNLLYKTDANGILLSFGYDALNRLTLKYAEPGNIYNFYWYDQAYGPLPSSNEVGQLTYVGHWQISGDAFHHDALGHVTNTWFGYPSEAGLNTGPSAVYDLAGNPTQVSYPDGRSVAQVFDAAGRLTTVTDATSGTAYFSNAQYAAAGGLTSASYGNGVTESIAYNNRLQPCHASANSPALTAVSGLGNVYDRASSYANSPGSSSLCGSEPGNNGNIAYIADNLTPGWTQSFGYDGLNRLLTASRSDGGYNHTYNYDSFGNLVIQDNLNPGPAYNINSATNQLQRMVNNVNAYTYDAAGNLTSSGTSDIGGHTFTYSALSQITAVDSGNTATYFYNGMDQRVFKETATGYTGYIYLGSQPMTEWDSTATWTDYIYAEGQKIAKITSAGTLNYYLDDHLGTTQVELDASGNVTWSGQFTPFGAELDAGGTTMHYKFTGKERDSESGLDYFGARYYASTVGRWMSPDWAEKPEAVPYSSLGDPQSLNLYEYVHNNPLSIFDPDGHGWWSDTKTLLKQDLAKFSTDAKAAVKTMSVQIESGLGAKLEDHSGTSHIHGGASIHAEVTYSRKGEDAKAKAEVDLGVKGPLGVGAGGERGLQTTSDSNGAVNGIEGYHESDGSLGNLSSNGEQYSFGGAAYGDPETIIGPGGGGKISVGVPEANQVVKDVVNTAKDAAKQAVDAAKKLIQ